MGISESGSGRLRVEDDPYEILKNSPIRIENNNSNIYAYFEPMGSLGPVALSDLAEALDVDHFNWVQHVTLQPDDWTLVRLNEERTDGVVVEVPWVDPDMHVANIDQMVMVNEELEESEPFVPMIADNHIFYFDDPGQAEGVTAGRIEDFTSEHVMSFEDAPRFPVGWFLSEEYVQFETKLVGVREDKSAKYFDDIPGMSFTWKCDLTSDGGSIWTAYYSDVPDALSGSIFDVQLSGAVPEPSALALLGLGGLLVLVRRKR